MREVLVIEDHPLVAEATAQLLVRRFDDIEVITANTAASALRLVDEARGRWFRIFLDLSVPGAFGLSLAKQIAGRDLAAICCVISAHDRDDYVQQLRAWGFLGYIAKSTPVETLTARISDAILGIGAFPSTLPAPRKSAIRLTARQTEILEGIQLGHSSKQIAARMHLAEGTVNNQVGALMQLLHADSRSHAVAKAIALGLLEATSAETQLP
jgi:DNA-binding NarL/FixJ family response regulator